MTKIFSIPKLRIDSKALNKTDIVIGKNSLKSLVLEYISLDYLNNSVLDIIKKRKTGNV